MRNLVLKFIATFLFILILKDNVLADDVRGVPFSKLSFYRPNTAFKCIDGSGTIDWSKVNDDYCDCRDGSDEPGTSACHNGLFYCKNKGYKGQYVLSSRVNDGICDCCDGSDEYTGIINCTDVCWELGAQAREKIEKLKQAATKGHEVYKEYVQYYDKGIVDTKSRLETISQEITKLNEDRLSAERTKLDAEKAELEAKNVFEEKWNKLKAENETKKEEELIVKAFIDLDSDNNGKITIEEIQSHHEFDTNQNGEVSLEEAKEYLNDQESVSQDEFHQKIWPNIKQVFKFSTESPTTDENKDTTEESTTGTDSSGAEKDHFGDEKTDEDTQPVKTEEKPKIEYDNDTNAYIAAADQARIAYNELNDKYNNLEAEKKKVEELLNIDFGPKNAFYQLAVNETCFDMTDREYIYTLCPFRRTIQKPSSGFSETDLGRWGHWLEEDGTTNYNVQVYENGLSCWNGPNRNTKVKISCGEENRLISATEPSRCEYVFEFETPAACNRPASEIEFGFHDEL